jgi:hypothetical protein
MVYGGRPGASARGFLTRLNKVVQVGKFELSERLGEHYGVRVRGYVVPPQTGSYTFVVNVDDAGEFGLARTKIPPTNVDWSLCPKHTCRKWDFCVGTAVGAVRVGGG